MILLTAASIVCTSVVARSAEVVVDASKAVGAIRPPGVSNGPLNFGEVVDLSPYYSQRDIPLARLHDPEWPNPDVVDIHAIFPDMNADPADPRNYQFSRTDDYIQPLIDAGIGIVYRLGESIEHPRKKYHVNPPRDCAKWTDVCIGIIRHYNEGWADGHHYGITYWEIWNEPENRPTMWTGTDEEYYRLYVQAAKAIKKRWPALKVGGPSAGHQGEFVGDRVEPSSFLKGFLEHCRANNAPLDFFSWHTYTNDPYLYARKARAIRRLLDDYGFTKTEIHLNEWNYLPDNEWIMGPERPLERRQWFERIGGPEGAAFLLCAMIDLQTAPVDVTNYYCGDTNWWGLFDRYGVPRKTFYAMRAFRMLLDTPVRVQASTSDTNLSVCAGLNQDRTMATIIGAHLHKGDEKVKLQASNLPWNGEAGRLPARRREISVST